MSGLCVIVRVAARLGAAMLWLACGQPSSGPSAQGPGARAREIPVVTALPTQQRLEERVLEREATIFPISMARLSTREEGFVRTRAVYEGDLVRKGDLIAQLDDTDRRLELTELRAVQRKAEVNVRDATRLWQRSKKLFARHVISEEQRDARLTRLESASAELDEVRARADRAEATLAQLRIVAPMDAVVSARFFEQGEYLDRGDPVVELKRIDSVVAVAMVSERDLHEVHVGGPAELAVTAFPGETFEGLVWKLIPDAQIASRSFPVWVLVPNPRFRLKTGMSARISFMHNLEDALLVPKDAVLHDGDEAFVFVVTEGRARHRVIELGRVVGENWHVRSGLEQEEPVVVIGSELLKDGDSVRAVTMGPPAPDLSGPLNAAQDTTGGS